MSKIVFVSTVSFAFHQYLYEIIKNLSYDNEVFLISNFDGYGKLNIKNVKNIQFNFNRNPNFFDSILILFKLKKQIKSLNPDVIYTISPITGFLVTLSIFFSNFKRVHFFTGQVWSNKSGLKRLIYKYIDKLISLNSDYYLIDSISQRNFLLNEKVIKENKAFVMGHGSIRGNKLKSNSVEISSIIKNNNLLFVGRINYEKGIKLILSFLKNNEVWMLQNNIKLDLVGGFEDCNIKLLFMEYKNIVNFHGHVDDLTSIYSLSKLLLLPSEREGFGSVVIEAGIYSTPSILTNIVGLVDSGQKDVSALFIEVNDYVSFEKAIKNIYEDKSMYNEFSEGARKYSKLFYEDIVTNYYLRFNNFIVNEC